MTTSNWLTLLGVAVALLGLIATMLFRKSDRERLKNEALERENKLLRETNIDLKIQLAGFQRFGNVLDRTLSGLPTSPRSEGSST